MTSSHAVIILASGLSLRLGHSKQLLSKDNQPLIHHISKLALATEPKAVFIVIPQDNQAIVAAISELVTKNSNVIVIVNPTPKTGMAHSLSLAIKALNDPALPVDRVLIMGVDQILLDSPHLDRLLAGKQKVVASRYTHLNEDFSVNHSKANIVGLPIAIDYKLLRQWQSQLQGDKGLRHLIRGLADEQIKAVINNKLSYDIDRPEQFAFAQAQGWLDS